MVYIYLLIISIFSSSVWFYLVNYVLLPKDIEGQLEMNNLIAVTIISIIAIASIFSFFHVIVDKLFFRKFYEKPRVLLAYQRGFAFSTFLISLGWLKILDFWMLHVVLLVIALFVLLIVLLETFRKGSPEKEEEARTRNGASLSLGAKSEETEGNEGEGKRLGMK